MARGQSEMSSGVYIYATSRRRSPGWWSDFRLRSACAHPASPRARRFRMREREVLAAGAAGRPACPCTRRPRWRQSCSVSDTTPGSNATRRAPSRGDNGLMTPAPSQPFSTRRTQPRRSCLDVNTTAPSWRGRRALAAPPEREAGRERRGVAGVLDRGDQRRRRSAPGPKPTVARSVARFTLASATAMSTFSARARRRTHAGTYSFN